MHIAKLKAIKRGQCHRRRHLSSSKLGIQDIIDFFGTNFDEFKFKLTEIDKMLSVLLEVPAEALSVVSVQSSYEFDTRI